MQFRTRVWSAGRLLAITACLVAGLLALPPELLETIAGMTVGEAKAGLAQQCLVGRRADHQRRRRLGSAANHAQRRNGAAVLQHGTVIVERDEALMARLFRTPATDITERVTSLKDERVSVSREKLVEVLAAAFARSIA